MAAAASEDPLSQATEGIVGWRNADSPGLGGAADKAVAALKPEEISGVLEDGQGLVIVKALGQREGTLPLEQVQEEIAAELLREQEGIKVASAQAQDYIRRALAGEALSAMFAADEDPAADAASSPEQPPASQPAKSPLKLRSTAPFSRRGRDLVPGIGLSKELSDLAFSLAKGQVAPRPVTVGQMVYLVASKDRQDPDMDQWSREHEELTESYLDRKAGERLRGFAAERCDQALQRGRISVNQGIFITPGYAPAKQDQPLPPYTPCSSLKERPMAG